MRANHIFITGNSRSGTTMMLRIMNNHSLLHGINEPHFFEKLWSPDDENQNISSAEAASLYENLVIKQREGFFADLKAFRGKYKHEVESSKILQQEPLSRLKVFEGFMAEETTRHGKLYPCEKTPQNVFYIDEILKFFPEALVINMTRDPRGVMLSQKKKWMRKYLGADFITPKEMWRLRINYHPITISKLWNAAMHAWEPFREHPRVLNIRFEDLLSDPEGTLKNICHQAGLPYEASMLQIPHAGSSTEADNRDVKGIRKSKATSWLDKGLTKTEIALCQQICKGYMQQMGYENIEVKPSPLSKAWSYFSFPFKVLAALLVNLNRMRNIGDTLKRRLAVT